MELLPQMPQITGVHPVELQEAYEKAFSFLKALENDTLIAIEALPPVDFWSYVIAGLQTQKAIALLPDGLTAERYEAYIQHLNPHCIIKKTGSVARRHEAKSSFSLEGLILLSTGGSGGKIKFAYHSWKSLSAAALLLEERLKDEYGIAKSSALELHNFTSLPLYHVSGLMPGVRAIVTKGSVTYAPGKMLIKALQEGGANDRWVSLVPTQLTQILEDPLATKKLKHAKGIFLGGAQASEELLLKAHKAHLPIYLSYGMTETAGMVTLSSALNFQKKQFHLGKPFSSIDLKNAPDGLSVKSPSLFHGYFPNRPSDHEFFLAQDEASWDSDLNLLSIERKDRFIISGGLKIDPRWVESLLLKEDEIEEAFIFGEQDAYWGDRVVACIAPYDFKNFHLDNFVKKIQKVIEGRYQPKQWLVVETIPKLANGKLDLLSIKALAKS